MQRNGKAQVTASNNAKFHDDGQVAKETVRGANMIATIPWHCRMPEWTHNWRRDPVLDLSATSRVQMKASTIAQAS